MGKSMHPLPSVWFYLISLWFKIGKKDFTTESLSQHYYPTLGNMKKFELNRGQQLSGKSSEPLGTQEGKV
jgi:hypothetical protein